MNEVGEVACGVAMCPGFTAPPVGRRREILEHPFAADTVAAAKRVQHRTRD